MSSTKFTEALNLQVGREFAASQQYIAIAVWFDDRTLPQLAAFFYGQALEERNHAMMMVQYLLDTDAPVQIPGVAAPKTDFIDYREPVALALEQERTVGQEIEGLSAIAHDERDHTSMNYVNWFLKEQVEEVATMTSLLQVTERAGDDIWQVEDYIARESPRDEPADPTAPGPAGGGV
ncbi:MAG: ferritin [Thermoleophilaceae bacterium]|nr:ferritin [Thermoleophilaceae bacterium]